MWLFASRLIKFCVAGAAGRTAVGPPRAQDPPGGTVMPRKDFIFPHANSASSTNSLMHELSPSSSVPSGELRKGASSTAAPFVSFPARRGAVFLLEEETQVN